MLWESAQYILGDGIHFYAESHGEDGALVIFRMLKSAVERTFRLCVLFLRQFLKSYMMTLTQMFAGFQNQRISENNLTTFITFMALAFRCFITEPPQPLPTASKKAGGGSERVRTSQQRPVRDFSSWDPPHTGITGGALKKKPTRPGSHPMQLVWGTAWVSGFLKILIHSRVKNWCHEVSLPVR